MRPAEDVPWIVGGDFNVILNEDKKLGVFLLSNKKQWTLHTASTVAHCWRPIFQEVLLHGGMVESRKTVFLKGWIGFKSIMFLWKVFHLLRFCTS